MANKKQILKTVIQNNWELKLFSLVLALLTFYSIRSATSLEVSYDVPVEVDLEEGIAVRGQQRTVHVTFQGSRADLWRLDQKLLKAVVYPKIRTSYGSERVEIKFKDIEKPSGVKVVNVVPDAINLKFDREQEKKVDIAPPAIIGKPLRGKIETDHEPQTVQIRGPVRIVKDIKFVETEPVDVEGRAGSFSKMVKVLPGNAEISHIEPSEINVNVNIVTDSAVRELTNITVMAVLKQGYSAKVELAPASVTVSFHGTEEVLEKIKANTIRAFVDCSLLEAGKSQKLPVYVFVPPAINAVASAEPDRVKVTLKSRKVAASKPEANKVKVSK